MKFIIIPMAVIITLFFFSLIYNSSTIGTTLNSNYSSQSANGTFIEDGTEKSLSTDYGEYNLATNETQGIIAIVIAVSVIGSLIGIRVLGSGLSEMTVKILYNTIFFYGIWALFSALSLQWFILIPIGGWIIYFVLTGTLSFGIVQQINGGSAE